jgi:subfamily B ATP-binding cassette protein MsbA
MNLSNTSLIKRIFNEHIVLYKKHLGFAVLCMILTALSTAALPFLIKDVFDDIFAKGDTYQLAIFCASVLGAFVVKGMASYGESVLLTYVGQKIISDIQDRLFKHIMKLDLAFFHRKTSGDLLSRLTNDVNLMRNSVTQTALNFGKDSITLSALIALMFYRDAVLASLSFFVFPAAIYPILKLGQKMKKVTYNTQEAIGFFTTELSQIFQSIRVVKSYTNENHEITRSKQTIDNIFKLVYKAARVRCAAHPIIETLGGIAIISVIAYGAIQVAHHDRTTGDFISFMLALILAYEPLKRLSNLNANLQEGLSAATRIFEILDEKQYITTLISAKKIDTVIGEIEFKNVSFDYDENQPVLKNLNFKIQPGETAAFVGPSGSGKSTLINLLPRFYDIHQGSISIDDKSVKDYKLEDLRHSMALVSQEIALFNRSIFDNIAYGIENATLASVQNAAELAAADEFIKKLPNNYETMVGENGVLLSGGQRQRIAIARAILKNAPILLLDEATSALDTQSERQVQKALKNLMKGRTTIMVAHRLSTVIDADKIYVLDQGQIIECGNHDTLILHNGHYKKLWDMQSI